MLNALVVVVEVLWLCAALSIARVLRDEADARLESLALAAGALALTAWRQPIPAHFFATVTGALPDHVSKIGLGWPALVGALSRLAPRTDWVAFAAARACGALTGPLAYAALRRVSGDRRAALLGAALLVALPFQVALATGDDAHPAALMLFLAGLCHLADYADRGRRGSFLWAAPCLVLMVNTRLETGFLLLAILALVARPRAHLALLRRDAPVLAVAVVAAAALTRAAIASDLERSLPYPSAPEALREAVRAVTTFPAMGESFSVPVTVLGRAPDLDALLFSEVSWAPLVLLPLLWVGWGWALFSGRGWRLLAAVLVARLPAYVYMNVDGTDYLGSRHFVGALPLLCLVAAMGALALGERLGRAAPVAAVCAVALFAAEARVPLRYRFAFQEEYAFLHRALAALPAGADVANIQFEFGLAPSESSLRLLRPDIRWIAFNWEGMPATRFAYLGPDCQALRATDLHDATRRYLHSGERLARLTHLIESCRRFEHLPVRRELARGTVSRRGHGPPPMEGSRFPIRLVELGPQAIEALR